jgi:hypothetical protein
MDGAVLLNTYTTGDKKSEAVEMYTSRALWAGCRGKLFRQINSRRVGESTFPSFYFR